MRRIDRKLFRLREAAVMLLNVWNAAARSQMLLNHFFATGPLKPSSSVRCENRRHLLLRFDYYSQVAPMLDVHSEAGLQAVSRCH